MAEATEPRRRSDDPSITVRLRPDLIERMNAACRARVVGRRLLIEAAIERLLTEFDREANDA